MEPTLEEQISEADAMFKKTCNQLVLLNNQIDSLQLRYDRAVRDGARAARYNHRIKLCAVEGIRNMFYEYAVRLADKIDALRTQAGMIVIRDALDGAMDTEEPDEWEDGYHSDEDNDIENEAQVEDTEHSSSDEDLE